MNDCHAYGIGSIIRICSDRWLIIYEKALNATIAEFEGVEVDLETFRTIFDENVCKELRTARLQGV